MTYKHLSQNERYLIFCLMKEGLNCTEIAKNLGRSTQTISKEIVRKKGRQGYLPKQADQLAQERSVGSRNARSIEPDVLKAAFERIAEQLSPEQVAAELPISHEPLYQHIYANKADGGILWKNLRCQKKKRKRYGGGTDRCGQIVGRPAQQCLISDSYSSADSLCSTLGYPTLGRPHAAALRFARCDQLAMGLAPVGVCPCWANNKIPRLE